nr:MAG TPA: hypothetical protein [Caudoviricetes sp.]
MPHKSQHDKTRFICYTDIIRKGLPQREPFCMEQIWNL